MNKQMERHMGISEADNHGVQGQVDEKYVYKHIVGQIRGKYLIKL